MRLISSIQIGIRGIKRGIIGTPSPQRFFVIMLVGIEVESREIVSVKPHNTGFAPADIEF